MTSPKFKHLAIAGAVGLACALSACSGSTDTPQAAQPQATGEYRILPANPLAANELHFVAPGRNGQASLAAVDESRAGRSILWSVNGQPVGRGESLQPGMFRRGDRVGARFEQDAEDVERAFVIIENSPPSVNAVSVSRDPARTEVAVAHFSAVDPDGDALTYHYEWSVGGGVMPGNDSAEYSLAGQNRGMEIAVRVSASDGQLVASRASTIARLQNHPPVLQIGSLPAVVELDEGRQAELSLSASDPDADAVTISVEGPNALYDAKRQVLYWTLAEGTEEFELTLRARDASGATSERTLRLKR